MNNRFEQAYKGEKLNHLELCCLKIAEKFGRGDYSDWRNSDYVVLSSEIRKETKIYISENTLKRIFGKLKTPDEYSPQKATRDALSIYIGYRDWEEMVIVENEKKRALSRDQLNKSSKNNVANSKQFKLTPNPYLLGGFLLILLASCYFYFFVSAQSLPQVQLICANPTGISPHSAIFNLHALDNEKINPKEFSIDFKSWRGKRTKWKDTLMSFYYEKPGVYFPVLYKDDKPIDTGRIILNTQGWEVTAQMQHDTTRLYPIVQRNATVFQPPEIDIMDIYRAGVDTLKTFFCHYSYVKPFSLSADNMSLTADIKTSPSRPGIRCSQVDVTVYGEKDFHRFTLIKPECISWSIYKFSEIVKNGQSDDLRELGHDLTKGKEINLVIKNRTISVSLDSELTFRTEYQKNIGNLIGIDFMFSGVGEINNLTLSKTE